MQHFYTHLANPTAQVRLSRAEALRETQRSSPMATASEPGRLLQPCPTLLHRRDRTPPQITVIPTTGRRLF